MKLIIFYSLLLLNLKSMAQIPVQGEYVFSRQEMVAAFNFLPDGKFEFFFSYGAVDRTASGTFIVEGNVLKLKSDKEAGNDFTIVNQSQTASGYVIRFEDPNKYLLTNIRCTFFIDGVAHEEFTDNHGEIKVDFHHCDKIFVRHELFPDIAVLIKDEKNKNNRFTLKLNPSLGQVSFKGLDLTIEDGKTISCIPNYFMMLENIKFEKQ